MEFTAGRAAVNACPPHRTYVCGTTVIAKSRKKENPAYPAQWVSHLNYSFPCVCVGYTLDICSLMPSHTHYASAELGTGTASREQQRPMATSDPSSGGTPAQVGATDEVPVLPEQVILRHKLSVAEIRELPRFRDYQAGHPTKVRHSIKKVLERSVTELTV